MSANHQNDTNTNDLLKRAAANPKVSRDTVNQLLKSLSEEDTKRLQSVLSDEQATKAILSSPQAQALLKKLSGKG